MRVLPMSHLPLWSLLVMTAACGAADAAGDRGTLATVIDSTADTVRATIDGDLPADAVRHLVTEVAIAPGIDDTTLFTNVFEFDVDRSGRFWVFDAGSSSIFLFGPDGALIKRIGREGAGPGEFQQNGGMVVRADNGIAQWDSRNSRISFLDSTGTFLTSWPLPGGFSTSNGLVTDASGALYLRRPVTDPRDGEILGRMYILLFNSSANATWPNDLNPLMKYVCTKIKLIVLFFSLPSFLPTTLLFLFSSSSSHPPFLSPSLLPPFP
jgi:hypothetical protein